MLRSMKDRVEVGPGDLLVLFEEGVDLASALHDVRCRRIGLHVRADALHHQLHRQHVPISAKLARGDVAPTRIESRW